MYYNIQRKLVLICTRVPLDTTTWCYLVTAFWGKKLLVISCGDRICAYFIIVKTMVIICKMLCEQHLGVVLKFFIQQLGIMITFCKKKFYTIILCITKTSFVKEFGCELRLTVILYNNLQLLNEYKKSVKFDHLNLESILFFLWILYIVLCFVFIFMSSLKCSFPQQE